MPGAEEAGVGIEDEFKFEGETSGVGFCATAETFGADCEKIAKDSTPANAVRATKMMATMPNRLFIFYLTI